MTDRRPAAALITAGGVWLSPDVCHPLWLALRAQLARHRADGGRVRPEVAAALDTLRAAALHHLASPNGHDERTFEDTPPASERELIRTEQLADRLHVTPRHARRLAAQAGVTPAARNAWHPDDVQHLTRLRKDPTCHPASTPRPRSP
ncbi:hypothetical protein LO772_16560 [Yinghuangia sp. ASG 101]|uniref:hypothetical protein n=1 Tax=Yinghuangia sp. ASG 101 TaxID=2896848 RepID=UPI001E375745|nr:hypothetical protein [Yinghuangia sp. ASG 101]UGQ15030.1 hypothetical protein LO772_16560 [Yinghuangia sp. ASG 101]